MAFAQAFWILLTGAFVASSCAMLGCFLVLRRQAVLSDALSHAILLGIVLASWLTGSLGIGIMFTGAVAVGLLTAFLVQWLAHGGVHHDAALGVTFTSFFALGVIGVTTIGQGVHLDLDCVLYGEIAYVPFDTWIVGGRSLGPRAVWINGALLLLNAGTLALIYKELKLCSFDPELAAAIGLPVRGLHYVLMALVAMTVVGAFENVGVILVVALIIAPAASAYLLTDRLSVMIVLAVMNGILATLFGYGYAVAQDCSIAGAIGSAGGLLFLAAFLFSPAHGVTVRWVNQMRLRRQVGEEDVLLWAGRQLERGAGPVFTEADLPGTTINMLPHPRAMLKRLLRYGFIQKHHNEYSLTDKGKDQFRSLIHRHRLYETYLGELGYAHDHLHDPADRVEHHITPRLTEAIDQAVHFQDQDPHGKTIPRDESVLPD